MKTYLDIDREYIESWWPNLEPNNHHETSPKSSKYNCFAWVLEKNDDRWAPYDGYTWFEGLEKIGHGEYHESDISYYLNGFKLIGYTLCDNGNFENGFEKIALYIKSGYVQHAAKQLEDGHWTSKLGIEYHDIEHYTLAVLEGDLYGYANIFMKRKRGIVQSFVRFITSSLKIFIIFNLV